MQKAAGSGISPLVKKNVCYLFTVGSICGYSRGKDCVLSSLSVKDACVKLTKHGEHVSAAPCHSCVMFYCVAVCFREMKTVCPWSSAPHVSTV